MSAAPVSLRADDFELAKLVSIGATQLAMPLAEEAVNRLVAYVRLIERWNATYNLTAIRDPRVMVTQHILDCLAAAAALARRRGQSRSERLVDVGSGAGLPGVVIAIASPERDVTCVDSVGKKAAFITQVAGTLGLKNLKAVHARIEGVADRFDVVASRAFSSLNEFVTATRGLIKDSGTWMAMKGKAPGDELSGLDKTLQFHVERLTVPDLAAERCVVWIEHVRSERTLSSDPNAFNGFQ